MIIESENSTDLHSTLSKQFLDGEMYNSEWIEAEEHIVLPFADVKSREWYFDGVRMAYSDWQFHRPERIDYEGNIKNDIVTLYFNLEGKLATAHESDYGLKTFELGKNQHNLFYSAASRGHFESREKRLVTFMVQFSLSAFLKITQNTNDALKRFSDEILSGKPAALSGNNLNLTSGMYNVISSLVNCKYQDALKSMYFFSKSIELLVMQAEAHNALAKTPSSFIKLDYDKDQLQFARDYLTRNMETPPSLSELARVCGINEYKLKRGFKETFGNTVFGYLSDIKLEKAKNDLLDRKNSASEIALALGYSSLQHFSLAFKKKFGFAPSRLVK